MCRPLPRRLLPGNQVVARNVGERRDLRLEEVDVDVHPLARLGAREEAGEDGRLGVQARRQVCEQLEGSVSVFRSARESERGGRTRDGDADLDRRPVRLARDVHEARLSLAARTTARQLRVDAHRREIGTHMLTS